MSRRIDIELTSSRDDGTWTWRAAGAKQPKGTLDGALLPDGAATGDVLRAEVDATLDGTEVLGVSAPKQKKDRPVERIELIGSGAEEPLVTSTLVPKSGRGRGDRDRGDRGDRGDRRGRRDGGRDGRGRSERGDRGDRGPRPGGERGDRGARRGHGGERRERPAPPARPKAKRLRPGRTHRKAALDALAPEEQVIGEQLLRGGIPGVRQAVEKQNEQARAEGRPEVKAQPLVAIAERLLPALRAAEWRDRAEAAVADLGELDLRDLRSVVVASDTAAKDDETRALATQLRDGLAARVEQEQANWLAEIASTLAEGRVVRALRLSSRPPKAGAPLPADLATKLSEATANSLTADTVPDRWATVLDALSYSPVRLTVAPASKPDSPSDELVAVVTKMAARTPKVAEAFGIEAPPEPARRRSRGGTQKGGAKKGGAKPKPPSPAATEAAPTETASTEPASTEPAPTEAASTEPAATETASTEAAPSEPTPSGGAAGPEPAPEAPVEADAATTDEGPPGET